MDSYRVQKYVADWLNSAGIQGLDHAHAAMPSVAGFPWTDYGEGAFLCQAVAFVTSDTDVRRSTPLHLGIRWQTWDVEVEFCMTSTDADWDQAEQRIRALVQSAKERVKTDPALGTAGYEDALFLAAAETRRGISARYMPPFVNTEGAREQWGTLSFQCASERTG